MDIDDNNHKANHCVYISFDNSDLSICSFINYLKATFNRHGIYQLDDQSDRFTERIRVLVVVFSRDYTFSAAENLVNQLRKKDLVVVPVLHGVTISSAAGQIAVLDQVTMWQRVLLDSAAYNEERSEYEFMEEIARDVCEKLYPTQEIGIHRRKMEIENLLCEQPWGVRTLGIFGKPGFGKTTLATALFRHMSGGYDASCIIKDFHTKYNEKRLEPLHPEYLSEIPMEKFHLNSGDSEPSHRKKRVLVALDDVRNAQDAKTFLSGFNKFGPGSLIIITSRNKQILEDSQMSETYELKGLNDEEALKLFTRCASGNDGIELSVKEIECYDGNPCAIRSYAKEVKKKTIVEMRLALPDICEIFITGNDDASCDIAPTTYMRNIPNEEDDEPQDNEEFPSDHNAVLATRDAGTIIQTPSKKIQSYYPKNMRSGLYNRLSKSMPSNPRVYRLDYWSVMRSLSEHLHRKHHAILQGLASQLQKLSQSFSNSGDHVLLEQHLQDLLILSGGCNKIKSSLDYVRQIRELDLSGLYGRREKKSGTKLLKFKLERDQAND